MSFEIDKGKKSEKKYFHVDRDDEIAFDLRYSSGLEISALIYWRSSG